MIIQFLSSSLVSTTSRPVANTSLNSSSCATFWTRNHLFVAQQAWRQHCEQTSPRKNIWTITNPNWKIQKIVHPIQSCTFQIVFTVAIRCLIDYLCIEHCILALFLIVHNPADAATSNKLFCYGEGGWLGPSP